MIVTSPDRDPTTPRVRPFDERRQVVELPSALARTSAGLSRCTDLEATRAAVVDAIRWITRTDHVLLLRLQRRRWTTVATSMSNPEDAGALADACEKSLASASEHPDDRVVYTVAEPARPTGHTNPAQWATHPVLVVRLPRFGHAQHALVLATVDADLTSATRTLLTEVVSFAALALDRAEERAELHEAVESRHRVGQAQGVLMHRYGLSADAAFAAMRRVSQNTNVKVRSIAEAVIRTGALEWPEADPSATTATPTAPGLSGSAQPTSIPAPVPGPGSCGSARGAE